MQIRLPQIILAALIVIAAISVVVVYFGGSDDPAPQVAANTSAPESVVDCTGDDGERLSAEDCADKLPLTNETSEVASLADDMAEDEAADKAEGAPSAPSAEEMTAADEAAKKAAEADMVAEKKRRKSAEKKAARLAEEKTKKAAEEKTAAERMVAEAAKNAEKQAAAEAEKAAEAKTAAKKTAAKKTAKKTTPEKKTAGKSKVPAAAREAGEVFVAKRSDRQITSVGETKPMTALVPGRYVVIGSFDSVANAQILQERYRNWGAVLVPIKLNGEPRQRVVIGPFSRAQMKGELSRVAETGVDGAWAMAVRLASVARRQ